MINYVVTLLCKDVPGIVRTTFTSVSFLNLSKVRPTRCTYCSLLRTRDERSFRGNNPNRR